MEENSSQDVGDSRLLGCTIDGSGGILIWAAYQITFLTFLTPHQHPGGVGKVKGNLLQNEWNQIHCLFLEDKQTKLPLNMSFYQFNFLKTFLTYIM